MLPAVVLPSAGTTRSNPWFWFHLWNLDAPCVAILWQLLFAKCVSAHIHAPTVAALGVSVWLIYASDHLLDAVASHRNRSTQRHAFHWRYRRLITIAAAIAFACLVALCPLLRPQVLGSGLSVAAAVLLYLLCIHALPSFKRRMVPKELLVGILFAVGTCLAPWCRTNEHFTLFLPASLFACLCCMNCAAIEVWEWRTFGMDEFPAPHAATLWISRNLRACLGSLAALSMIFLFAHGEHCLFAALLVSASAFLALDFAKHRLSVHALRVLADMPLFSPLFFLLLMH